jgi:ribonuclease I
VFFLDPEWPNIGKALENQTRQNGMRFGIIYIGDTQDTFDAEWSSKVVSRFQTYQGQNGGHPEYVLFQSWQPHPQFCLPETDPTSFTGVINAYIDATT